MHLRQRVQKRASDLPFCNLVEINTDPTPYDPSVSELVVVTDSAPLFGIHGPTELLDRCAINVAKLAARGCPAFADFLAWYWELSFHEPTEVQILWVDYEICRCLEQWEPY